MARSPNEQTLKRCVQARKLVAGQQWRRLSSNGEGISLAYHSARFPGTASDIHTSPASLQHKPEKVGCVGK